MDLAHTHQYLQRTQEYQKTEGTRRLLFVQGCPRSPPFTSAFPLWLCEVQLSTAWCKARVTGTKVAPKGIGACCIERAHVQALIDICVVEKGREAELANTPTKVMLPILKHKSGPLNNGNPTRDYSSQNPGHLGGAM